MKDGFIETVLKPQLKNVRIDYEWGGTMEKFDLFADMKHFRIPGSQWIGNQIIALGMLYFRLKDRL